MSKIRNKTIEIFEDGNPLEVRTVTAPVRGDYKVMCHESYVVEALKKYDMTCTEEVLDNISSYESGTYRTIREGVVSSFNEKNETANINLSPKHTVQVGINTRTDNVIVGGKIDTTMSILPPTM